jgi:hypothetical protein
VAAIRGKLAEQLAAQVAGGAPEGGPKQRAKRKYRNVHTEGLWFGQLVKFHSKKEAGRAQELQLLQKAGKISELRRQQTYPFILCSPQKKVIEVTHYTDDFDYIENGRLVVEDVKSEASTADRAYGIRKKLMLACYDIEVKEV